MVIEFDLQQTKLASTFTSSNQHASTR